jgi:hypothetical protein
MKAIFIAISQTPPYDAIDYPDGIGGYHET